MEKIKINIYCDESEITSIKTENWTYYGVLIIPTDKTNNIYTRLLNSRCISNKKWNNNKCEFNCGYHEKNNTEIHYKNIKQNHKYIIASNWIKVLLDECINDEKIIYFNILGLDRTLIDKKYWKHLDQPDNLIYSRFLFSIFKSLKYFFPNSNIIEIHKIVHDPASIQNETSHYYEKLFDDLERDDSFHLESKKIHFVESDHKISNNIMDSHFLQYIDLILGLTVNYIHCNTKNKYKQELTYQISPLIKRIIESPYNENSKYNYYRRKSIQFFPRKKDFYKKINNLYGEESIEVIHDLFYHDKKCLFEEYYNRKKHRILDYFFQ